MIRGLFRSLCLWGIILSAGAFAATYYVPADYSTIQSAIDASTHGDTIIVSTGTYYENINFNGKNIILTSINPEDSNVVATTIIDGNQNASVVTFSGTETPDCVLTGFTITNGDAEDAYGAGVDGNGTQSTITYCTIIDNPSDGLYACHGSIENCTIVGNLGRGLKFCQGRIFNCTIRDNFSHGLMDCNGSITNCTIVGNRSVGVYHYLGSIANQSVTNCIIWGNNNANLQLSNDITPNYSCIQNWTGGGTGNISSNPKFVDTSSTDPVEWDLHLLPGSPCLDTGTNAPPGGLPETDIEGNQRPFDGDLDGNPVADMGVYEFSLDPNLPFVYATPKLFYFTADEGDADPDGQILIIQNLGGETLNWSIDLANKPDWLSINLTSGSLGHNENNDVTLAVDITGLPEGTYSYSFRIIDPSAYNSPQWVTVYLGIGNIYVPATYPTIQAAIDAAIEDDTIIVLPGTYYENISIDRDIKLTSIHPDDPDIVASTIIDNPHSSSYMMGTVVTFSGNETPNCVLLGFTIQNGYYFNYASPERSGGAGIWGNGTHASIRSCIIKENRTDGYYYSADGAGISECDGLISNCLIVNNTVSNGSGGGLAYCDGAIVNCTIVDNDKDGLYSCDGLITNCIIWGNAIRSSSTPTYSCVGGTGNLTSNPLFADPNNGDYHLKSEYGRWDSSSLEWVYDDVTSPCIDAGDPNSIEWQNELWPHGDRINVGAYGGTPQASMSPNPVGNVADLDHDDIVDTSDFMMFGENWLWTECLLDTDLNRNGKVDIADFAEFGKQWLWVEP